MGPVPDPPASIPEKSAGPVATPAEDSVATTAEDSNGLDEPQYEVAVKLADLQGDPNSPLYSVKRFEDLGL